MTLSEDWFYAQYGEELQQDILMDEAYLHLYLSLDLERIAIEKPGHFLNPDLIRHKLLLKYHQQGFGGSYPALNISGVEKKVNTRRLPPGIKINPTAMEWKLYTMDEQDQRLYHNSLDLMATVTYGVGHISRRETVELILLLATPAYREKAVHALDLFVVSDQQEQIRRHFLKG